jgi:hypothetical protein
MDTLSVNLSRDDVAILIRAVEEVLAGCACGRAGDGRTCERCRTLSAVQVDLAQVVARRPSRRMARPVRWGANPGARQAARDLEHDARIDLASDTPLAC